MGDSSDRKMLPLIPPQESRCVWMTAGILSYQLCEREFECEQCPLDVALRQRFVSREVVFGSSRAAAPAHVPEEPRGGVLYGRKHIWVRPRGEKIVRFGIEPGLASVLISPKAVVLPALGERIVRNKVCSWIVLGGGTLPIVSPITGQVVATNIILAQNPHAVRLSPLGDGWLFELSVDCTAVHDADVLPIADVARIYADDERRFHVLLYAELGRRGVVGQTLADGGQALESFSDMLGPTRYFKLIRHIYS